MGAGARWRQALSGIALWAVPGLLGALLARTPLPQVANLQNFLFDHYQALSPRPWSPDLPVRIVDIDDASLAKYGQWPWPRTLLAKLNDRLTNQKPLALVYDFAFAEPDRLSLQTIIASLPNVPERQKLADALGTESGDNDEAFAQSLGRGRDVLGYALTNNPSDADLPAKAGISIAGDDPTSLLDPYGGAEMPILKLADQAKGLGAINYTPERDLIVRRIPLVFRFEHAGAGRLVPSLDAEALRVAQLEADPQDPSAPLAGPSLIVKSANASGETGFGAHTGIVAIRIGQETIQTEKDGAVRVRFAGKKPGRFIPAWKVLEGNFDQQDIEGRIILVGTSAAALGDVRSTPLQPAVPGVEIHAELLEHILTGAQLFRPDYAPGGEATLSFLGAALMGLLAQHLRALTSALAGAAFTSALFGLSYWAFASGNMLFDPLIPAATAFTAWGFTSVSRYRQTERARRAVYELMGRYVSPAVAARLASDPSMLKLGGETRYVTVLFCDIRDFTARSEILSATEIIEFLNALYGPLSDIVTESGGTIDKFIGDAVMAYWNAPLPMPEHADVACRAALAMLAAIPRIDAAEAEKAQQRGYRHIPVRIGIGINMGDVVMGNVGSESRRNFSIIGDPVNVAARLESATKQFGVNILVSEGVAAAAKHYRFTPLGEADLKGKSRAVQIFTLSGPVEDLQNT
ncbi:CHASE2 domain-containing protein [Methylovirgula sp. 4M-Z18]|uniref:CHASE2 domain-containing protein n=1 Tax=Methylovirgula sp. 4M-Z18 TaxID=2293567 RepID=UPI000E2E5967|nr:adenylate/guanylate cyclase domain-containing protein [Methylovirgula sp. 4M-Z18]RFB80452.1 adenylate/guanylate cyclase domain-containing protein [Methylovirgula sp. 4M-Z18]